MKTFSMRRFCQPIANARQRSECPDAGMTLIEMLIAITLVTVGVLGLLAGLAADIKQQRTEKTQTNAVHLASSALESARSLPWSKLIASTGTSTSSQTVGGVAYTYVTNVQVCSPTDPPGTCTTPASGAAATARTTVAVSWNNAGTTHTVRMSRDLADTDSTTVSTTTNPLGSCGGGGTTLVVGHLSLSPSTVAVNSAGTPATNVTATLTATGISNASCIPLTWSDDTGSHQALMTGGGGTYSVTIPPSSITKSVGTTGGSVAFTATVPGSQAVPSASLMIAGQPSFSGNCSISVVGLPLSTITLVPLTRNSLLATSLTCTTTNLARTDTVTATYASGVSPATRSLSMTSTDGTTWTASLPAGTTLVKSGVSEAFTFSLARASDGATATQNATATLA
jgi:prepilin-type N-terminal cleavage/methylation domain-containing protein